MTTMDNAVTLRPVRRHDATQWADVVAEVARERRFLASVDGFSIEETRAYLGRLIDTGCPALVAEAGDRFIGWCDICRRPAVGFDHVGTMGLGVVRQWRGQGIGRRLIDQCVELARKANMHKIELVVYHDNAAAVRLYESFGFVLEGRRKESRRLDGITQDELLMALFL